MARYKDSKESVLVRKVKPVGNLLNDNDSEVDQLGYHVYAKALATLIHSCTPPITVGIFGPWGIGKTFILKHVQGLLRKYEQQQDYNVVETGKKRSTSSHAGASTEVDGRVENESVSTPKNKIRKKNSRRACFVHYLPCTVCLVILAAFVALLVMVTVSPQDQTLELEPFAKARNETDSVSKKVPQGRIAPIPPESANLTKSSTPEPATGNMLSSGVQLFILLLLIFLIFICFAVFCFCVTNTSSKSWQHFRNNFMLVFYAAFTRIPSVTASPSSEWIEANKPYMVRHFNDDAAILRPYDPGEEENIAGVRITSRKVRSMRSKYIFVNYQAWQYVGSDTLWAGIVTSLSDAIEKEFGSVCVRLFRMIQVERPSKSGPIKGNLRSKEDPRAIYIRFIFKHVSQQIQQEKVMLIVKEYGVVTACHPYREDWWYVRFSCDKEADYARTDLKLVGYEVVQITPKGENDNSGSSRQEAQASAETDNPKADQPLFSEATTSRGGGGNRCEAYSLETRTDNGRSRGNRSQCEQPKSPSDFPKEKGSTSCCSSCCICCIHFKRHPKTVCCGCPYLYCWIIFIVAALILPFAVLKLADQMKLGVIKSNRSIPVAVQIFSWFPAVLGVLFVALRFCWAMCHSQTSRIRKALAGTKGSMENALGFMNSVKSEVMIMTRFINCVRFTHGIDYKIVITIDDLDRCPYEKVKSVLEAVSILLSDRSSPFLCMIAVDSRVAVKCIERDMGEVMLQAHLTGHEYLKKIINLPFCLPEVSNNRKRKYFGGIMDVSDETAVERSNVTKSNDRLPRKALAANVKGIRSEDSIDAIGLDDIALGRNAGPTTELDGGDVSKQIRFAQSASTTSTSEQFFDDFLIRCREIIHGKGSAGQLIHQHMNGNPRNMKRIFNVMCLTTHLLKCLDDQITRRRYLEMHSGAMPRAATGGHECLSTASNDFYLILREANVTEDLVKWIVAADQWPYRISYILQVIEDSDHRRNAGLDEEVISDDCKLSVIYEKFVEAEISKDTEHCSMLTLDHDPALLRSFLRGSPSLTRKKIAILFPVTLNLDQSVRNSISRQRVIALSSGIAE